MFTNFQISLICSRSFRNFQGFKFFASLYFFWILKNFPMPSTNPKASFPKDSQHKSTRKTIGYHLQIQQSLQTRLALFNSNSVTMQALREEKENTIGIDCFTCLRSCTRVCHKEGKKNFMIYDEKRFTSWDVDLLQSFVGDKWELFRNIAEFSLIKHESVRSHGTQIIFYSIGWKRVQILNFP
jgi:hypothetical protein